MTTFVDAAARAITMAKDHEAPPSEAREEHDEVDRVRDDRPLLFCPFCREVYEGETVCPDHELALVAFDALPKRLDVDDLPADDEPLPVVDPRFGRGLLFGAAVLGLIGFVLPMVTTSSPDDSIVSTGMGVASRVAPNLFVIPAISMGLFSILFRRRTLLAMRGARIVVPAMAGVGAASLAYTLFRIREGAVHLGAQLGVPVTVEPDLGVWVMASAMAIALVAGLRFGVVRRRAGVPHGADGES